MIATWRTRLQIILPATSLDLFFGVSALQGLSQSVGNGFSTALLTMSCEWYSIDGVEEDLRHMQDKSKVRNACRVSCEFLAEVLLASGYSRLTESGVVTRY